jgi:hypothetical protein
LRGLSRQVGKGKREKKRGKVESRKEKKEEDCGCAITKVFFFFPALPSFLADARLRRHDDFLSTAEGIRIGENEQNRHKEKERERKVR